jgi:hypothetical protein
MTSPATAATTADTVLSKLQSDVQGGQIAIFLGAGISAALAESYEIDGFNLASWGGLLKHGAKWAKDWCGEDEDFVESTALDVRATRTRCWQPQKRFHRFSRITINMKSGYRTA